MNIICKSTTWTDTHQLFRMIKHIQAGSEALIGINEIDGVGFFQNWQYITQSSLQYIKSNDKCFLPKKKFI